MSHIYQPDNTTPQIETQQKNFTTILEAEREFQANLAMKGWSQKENLKTNQVFEEKWTQHTVGTIARARFNTQGVVAGVIVGIGTNAAYVQSAHANYVQNAHAISIGLIL